MSAEAEQVFLEAQRQILQSRASLGEEMIEKIECLKHQLTKNAVDNVKFKLVDEALDSSKTLVVTDQEGGDIRVLVEAYLQGQITLYYTVANITSNQY